MFYPPIFGLSESPIKAGSDELSPISIKWLKSQVFGPSMPLQKSGILPLPYVFYPQIFGSSECPLKAGSDELSPIRIKWLKSQVFWVLVHPSQKSGILPLPCMFYPPIFGSFESPIKAGSDGMCPIWIKWLKSPVILF